MSRVFDALQESQRRRGQNTLLPWEFATAPQRNEAEDHYEAAQPGDRPDNDGSTVLALHPTPENRLVALGSDQDLGSEKFRLLASQLRIAQKSRSLRRFVITSSVTGEGKSLVSVNLAIALAKVAGQRTLLIDADHRHATITNLLNCQPSPGLRDWLLTQRSVWPFLRHDLLLPLWFLPAGTSAEGHSRLRPEALSAALASIDGNFDVILIDCPPVLLADATIWITVADAYFLVARQGKTPKKMLKKALGSLASQKLLGIVLNEHKDSTQKYFHEYYGAASSRQTVSGPLELERPAPNTLP